MTMAAQVAQEPNDLTCVLIPLRDGQLLLPSVTIAEIMPWRRIKVLEGRIPGSMELKMTQKSLQPPDDSLGVLDVIKGVIDAEQGAIDQYQKIIELSDGVDPVTQDLCIEIKGDEEEHRRLFRGYLREAESMKM